MKFSYKASILFLLSLILYTEARAQNDPAIEWQNTIGGTSIDVPYGIEQTYDGGYIIGGESWSGISGDKTENCMSTDYWILKTNSLGSIQWQSTIGGDFQDQFRCIHQTSDGGYILGGFSESGISGDKTEESNGLNDYWIVKINSLGVIQWQNTIGGDRDDELYAIRQTTDGGYILGGTTSSNASGDISEGSSGYDYWIVKTNATGIVQWEKTIGGISNEFLYSINKTADGGYILGGYSGSDISGDKTQNCIGDYDYWLVKTDASGNIQWDRTIGGSDEDRLTSVQQTTDGGYILGGSSKSDSSDYKSENSVGLYNIEDYWIVKTDSTGNIQWENTIGSDDGDEFISVQQTADGGYVIGGYSSSDISGDKTENGIGGWDYWIVKTDAWGIIKWQNTIGGNSYDVLRSMRQTSDGGYILAGNSISGISGDKTESFIGVDQLSDYWIIKLSPTTGIDESITINNSLLLSPNPATDFVLVSSQSVIKNISIFNLIGEEVYTVADHNRKQYSLYFKLPSGIYFVKTESIEESAVKKLIVE